MDMHTTPQKPAAGARACVLVAGLLAVPVLTGVAGWLALHPAGDTGSPAASRTETSLGPAGSYGG